MVAFVSLKIRLQRESQIIAHCILQHKGRARGEHCLCWTRWNASVERRRSEEKKKEKRMRKPKKKFIISPHSLLPDKLNKISHQTYSRFLIKHCIHILIWNGRHVTNITIVAFDPFPIAWNVFGVEKFRWWRIFAQTMVGGWARVHEGLSNNTETRVNDIWLVNVEYEVGIFYQINPKSVEDTRITLRHFRWLGFPFSSGTLSTLFCVSHGFMCT